MIAVYYVGSGGPCNMYVLAVKDDDFTSFLKKLDEQSYPYPESDVLFIDNEKVINTWEEKDR